MNNTCKDCKSKIECNWEKYGKSECITKCSDHVSAKKAGKSCGAVCDYGWAFTRLEGHTGMHEASDIMHLGIATWGEPVLIKNSDIMSLVANIPDRLIAHYGVFGFPADDFIKSYSNSGDCQDCKEVAKILGLDKKQNCEKDFVCYTTIKKKADLLTNLVTVLSSHAETKDVSFIGLVNEDVNDELNDGELPETPEWFNSEDWEEPNCKKSKKKLPKKKKVKGKK